MEAHPSTPQTPIFKGAHDGHELGRVSNPPLHLFAFYVFFAVTLLLSSRASWLNLTPFWLRLLPR